MLDFYFVLVCVESSHCVRCTTIIDDTLKVADDRFKCIFGGMRQIHTIHSLFLKSVTPAVNF